MQIKCTCVCISLCIHSIAIVAYLAIQFKCCKQWHVEVTLNFDLQQYILLYNSTTRASKEVSQCWWPMELIVEQKLEVIHSYLHVHFELKFHVVSSTDRASIWKCIQVYLSYLLYEASHLQQPRCTASMLQTYARIMQVYNVHLGVCTSHSLFTMHAIDMVI